MLVLRILCVMFFLTGKTYAFQPEISVSIDKGEIRYIHDRKEVFCGGIPAAGCTKTKLYMAAPEFEFFPDGTLRKVYLDFSLRETDVTISSLYPRGSCEFDLVLKHELTHLALARAVLKRYAGEISKALLAKIDEQKTVDVMALRKIVDRLFIQMVQEKNKQDALLDAPGAEVYQWSQCLK